jgi:alanyl-tRNA synthetase
VALVRELGELVGGSGGGTPELAVAGGRDPSRLDEALGAARRALASR